MSIFTDKHVKSEAAKSAWKLLPGPLSAFFGESVSLLKDGYLLVQKKQVPARNLREWRDVANLGRSEQRVVHMNAFIGDAIRVHQDAPDQSILIAALRMALLWADAHTWSEHSTSMAYHDETTARRVAYWTRLLIVARTENVEPDMVLRLEERLSKEASVLAQDSFYAGKNNHGMFQNFAIIYYCALIEYSDSRVKNSLNRLLEYFEWSVGYDGVHKEHSPSYNYLIARNMAAHIELFGHLDKTIAQRIGLVLERMSRYALSIVAPDGHYPPLGDTPPMEVPKSYRRTFSKSPKPPVLESCAVFQEGGYAILRSCHVKDSLQTFAVFSASHHGVYHKHADDLAFILYSGGWIISESGPYGYDYNHPLSKHAYSTAGHSTLHIPTLAMTSEPGKVGILKWSDKNSVSAISARNLRYKDLSHERTVTFDRNQHTITIEDKVVGGANHQKYILWQLAPDLTPVKDGLQVDLLRANQLVARILFSQSIDTEAIIIGRGSSNKEILGYSFPTFGQVVDTAVLAIAAPCLEEKWSVTTTILLPSALTKSEEEQTEPSVGVSVYDDGGNPKLLASATCDISTTVAFYLNHNGTVIEKRPYSSQKTSIFNVPPAGGVLTVRAFFHRGGLLIKKINSPAIHMPPRQEEKTS